MAFADEDDLAALRDSPVSSEQAELALELASAAIKEYVGWNVEQETLTYVGDGGTATVYLPTLRLTAVTNVTEAGITLYDNLDYTWTQDGRVRRFPWGGYWVSDPATVSITYTHGYAAADVPGIFKAVCLQVGNRLYGNPEALQTDTVGGISEGYAVSAANYTWGPSLMPSEERLLSRYRLHTFA